jgi:predicted phage terminase large subunit-like protein
MHDDIFAACDDEASGKRVARIAPRKMGKTTIISLVLPARALAYQKKFFVLLIGESADTAEANLGTLSQELETNELLLRDFPHLRPAVDARGQTVKWTDRQIVLANYATVRAKGMGARMRGMKHRQRRPDLAILDDPESPETADTFLKRIRHKRWFGGTFMGLGADTWDIFVIGNLPHHDCLIAGLVCDSGWDGRLWRAENIPPREKERYPIGNTKTDGSALWPEVWSITALRKYAAEPEVGALGYAREMMNDPREEENKAFSPGEFCYFDYDHDMLKTYRELAISLDPAGGENPGEVKRGKRDYAVAAVMGRTADGHIDVIDVWMKKVLPDAQIDAVLDLYTVYGGYISVEENMYKNLLKTSMERAGRDRGLYPVVKVRTSAQNKVTRILSLQPPIRQRIMRFANHLTEKYPEFFAQFDEFPGTYDDAPDSVEGGLRALEKRNFSGTRIISLTGSSHWKEKA